MRNNEGKCIPEKECPKSKLKKHMSNTRFNDGPVIFSHRVGQNKVLIEKCK